MGSIYYKNKVYAGGSDGGSGASNIYSTTEQIIGTWVNGDPVYRIVFDNTQGTYGTNQINIDVSDLDIDILLSVTAYITDQSGSKFILDSPTANLNNLCVVNNSLIIQTLNSNYTNWYIIVEYTKETITSNE